MELPVIIEKVIYRSENGFAILAANLNSYSDSYKKEMEDLVANKKSGSKGYDNFIVTTNMLGKEEYPEGRQYVVSGKFIQHSKYGDQFQTEFMFHDEPKNEDGMITFLMTLPNIKEKRSCAIIRKFGVEGAINIFDNEPEKLLQINGINKQRLPSIIDGWKKEKCKRELFFWLIDHNVPPSIGQKVYEKWGRDSIKILSSNPYKLTDLKGMGFLRADAIAYKILKVVPKEIRVIACLEFVLKEYLHSDGNLCMPYPLLKRHAVHSLEKGLQANNPDCQDRDYSKTVPLCIKNNKDKFVAVKNISGESNVVFVYIRDIWDKEKYIANEIYRHFSNKDIDKYDVEKFL